MKRYRSPPDFKWLLLLQKCLIFFVFENHMQSGVAKRKKRQQKKRRQEIASEDDNSKRAALSKSGRDPNVCLNCFVRRCL